MYLTKEDCETMLSKILKEIIGLFNEQQRLLLEYNINDFNPNEKKIEEIKKKLVELNKIVDGLEKYMSFFTEINDKKLADFIFSQL
jgi:hypothetical protein